MEPKQLFVLLKEASHPQCSRGRASEIDQLITLAARANNTSLEQASFVMRILRSLFWQTYDKNRAALPGNYGTFALFCCPKPEENSFAVIDWSVTETNGTLSDHAFTKI